MTIGVKYSSEEGKNVNTFPRKKDLETSIRSADI